MAGANLVSIAGSPIRRPIQNDRAIWAVIGDVPACGRARARLADRTHHWRWKSGHEADAARWMTRSPERRDRKPAVCIVLASNASTSSALIANESPLASDHFAMIDMGCNFSWRRGGPYSNKNSASRGHHDACDAAGELLNKADNGHLGV